MAEASLAPSYLNDAYNAPCAAISLHHDVLQAISLKAMSPFTLDCSAQDGAYPPVAPSYIPTIGEAIQHNLAGQHTFVYTTSDQVLPILQHYLSCKVYDPQHTSATFVVTSHVHNKLQKYLKQMQLIHTCKRGETSILQHWYNLPAKQSALETTLLVFNTTVVTTYSCSH